MVSKEYLEHLWFVLHHSDDPERLVMAVTCYLDESGITINPENKHAVVAGLVMSRDNFLLFDVVWNSILSQPKFNIQSPIHMKEFSEHGRFGHIDYPIRTELFNQLVGIINCHKTHSVAATISHEQYNEILNTKIKRHIGVYGMCFTLCAILCFAQAKLSNYYGEIAFILEQGARHKGHILNGHNQMVLMQKSKELSIKVGSIAFEPKRLSALQAADIIAWGVRRRINGLPIGKGFQPISKIFEEKHRQGSIDDNDLKKFLNAIMDR